MVSIPIIRARRRVRAVVLASRSDCGTTIGRILPEFSFLRSYLAVQYSYFNLYSVILSAVNNGRSRGAFVFIVFDQKKGGFRVLVDLVRLRRANFFSRAVFGAKRTHACG